MNRLKVATLLVAVIFAILGAAFLDLGTRNTEFSWIRIAWLVFGVATLFSTAIELACLILWTVDRLLRREAVDLVPARLEPDYESLILHQQPRVALIMPANNEAATRADRTAMHGRLCQIARQAVLCARCDARLIVLFDTDTTSPGHASAAQWERDVIRGVNRELGGEFCEFREYRQKPGPMRTKQGSIDLFLNQEGVAFDFLFVLDADSCFPESRLQHGGSVDPIDRLVAAMLLNPQLSMIQCSIHIPDYDSILGWSQHLNARIAANYYSPLNQRILGSQLPSYGHNVLLRVSDLTEVYATQIPQQFLSHDYVEAALLARNGRHCIHTQNVTTIELPENTMDGFIDRELRWQRGNAQWAKLLTCERLPLAVNWYLTMGILNYLLPLMATMLLFCSAALIMNGEAVFESDQDATTLLLIGSVVLAIAGPKLAASLGLQHRHRLTLAELAGLFLISLFICPAQSAFTGLMFAFAPLKRTGWKIRACRSARFGSRDVVFTGMLFVPLSIVGIALSQMVIFHSELNFGNGMVIATTLILAISPLSAALVSIPVFRD